MYHQFMNAQLARMDVAVTSIQKIQEAAEQISARLSRGSAVMATLEDQLVADIVAAAKATEETRKETYSKMETDQTALDVLITDLEKERKIVKEAKDSIEEHLKTGGKDSSTADPSSSTIQTATPDNQPPLNATITMAEQKTHPATMTVTPPTLSNARPSELLPKVNPLTDHCAVSQLTTPMADPATATTHDTAPSTPSITIPSTTEQAEKRSTGNQDKPIVVDNGSMTVPVPPLSSSSRQPEKFDTSLKVTEEPLPYNRDDALPLDDSRKESNPRGRSEQLQHHDSPTKRSSHHSSTRSRVSYRSRSRSRSRSRARSTRKSATKDGYKTLRRDTPRKKTVRRSEEPSRSQTNRYNKRSRDNSRSTKDTRVRLPPLTSIYNKPHTSISYA